MTVVLLLVFATALSAQQDVVTPVLPLTTKIETDKSFQWRPALEQSMRALMLQHGFRIAAQPKTRQYLGGKFFPDYVDSIKGVKGWEDGDNVIVNYFNHPVQGSVTNYIYINNHPRYRTLEFENSREYWVSRLKALAWTTFWSTQFEIGPLSEASIGNVGMTKGTSGYVDFVMTPAGGMALTVMEDWLDKRFVQRWEANTTSASKRTLIRMAMNPSRTLANILRGKRPWYRDGRDLMCTPRAVCP